MLVVFGTGWDGRQLAACRPHWEREFELRFSEPDSAGTPWAFDILGWLAQEAAARRGQVDGVFSSCDEPGAAAAAVLAEALGLPGPPPAAVLTAAHKFHSRLVQRACAPEAVPPFALIDPGERGTWDPATGFPCFVKPVRGSFSVLARRVDDRGALLAHLASAATREHLGEAVAMFDALVRRHTDLPHGGAYLLAEGLLRGTQVTLEGYCRGAEVTVLGFVDSGFHPGTTSFSRFDLPSALPAAVQRRMADVARRVVSALGLRDSFFNLEFFWDEASDRVSILELNPRICGQFGDLWQKTTGVNSFEIALALACGAELPAPRAPAHACAASFPLRIFEPARVTRAPSAADVAAAEALFPGTQVWLELRQGDLLSDFQTFEDGGSVRYAVVNLGAASREEASARLAAVVERLGFRFEPLGVRA